ncbi:MAG: hypothetical protein WB696_14340 [Chthoniobacterales bacterium]
MNKKKVPLPPFFSQSGLTLHELLNLRLRETDAIKCHSKPTKHFLKAAIPDHFIDFHRSFFGWRSDDIAIPMLEIGINVAKDGGNTGKRFLTIGWTER